MHLSRQHPRRMQIWSAAQGAPGRLRIFAEEVMSAFYGDRDAVLRGMQREFTVELPPQPIAASAAPAGAGVGAAAAAAAAAAAPKRKRSMRKESSARPVSIRFVPINTDNCT